MNEALKQYLEQGLIWHAAQNLPEKTSVSDGRLSLSIKNETLRHKNTQSKVLGGAQNPELIHEQAMSTGYSALDTVLQGQGWPVAAVIELLSTPKAHSELRLLLPAYRQCSQHFDVVFVNPPYVFNGTALQQQGIRLERTLIIRTESKVDTLWALQQCLLSHTFAMVVGWLPDSVSMTQIKKLRVACAQGPARCFLYRTHSAARTASAADLRLLLRPLDNDRLGLTVIKQRGCSSWQELMFSLHPKISLHRAIPTYQWPLLQANHHKAAQQPTPDNAGKGPRLNRLN